MIAEFMGCELKEQEFPKGHFQKLWRCEIVNPLRDYIEANQEDQLYFHSDWNWLMTVLMKIESLQEPTPPKMDKDQICLTYQLGCVLNKWCKITFTNRKLSEWKDKHKSIPCDTYTFSESGKTILEATYLTIVKFIDWYNTRS